MTKDNKFEWTKEATTALIEAYETHPVLYDPKNKFYTNKHARADAWERISNQLKTLELFSDVDVISIIKTKITNLRQQLCHENQKKKIKPASGSGLDEDDSLYDGSPWWFEKLKFLVPIMKTRKSKSSLDEDSQTSDSPLISDELPRNKKVKLGTQCDDDSEGDPILEKTMSTLQILGRNIEKAQTKTPQKTEADIFGEYIASELRGIGDQEILNDVKHEMTNSLYEAKKRWLKALKEKQEQVQLEYHYIYEDGTSNVTIQ